MARICGIVAALALVHFLAAAAATTATSAPLVLVFIKEQCYQPALDIGRLKALAERQLAGTPWALSFVPKSGMCSAMGERTSILGALQDAEVAVILGSVHPSLCSLMDALVLPTNKTVITWSCPHQDLLPAASEDAEIARDSKILRLSLPLAQIVRTVVRTVKHLRFKSAAIVTAGSDWWRVLASGMALSLSAAGVDVRFRVDFGGSDVAISDTQATQSLRPLSDAAAKGEAVNVLIAALPLYSDRADLLLREIGSSRLARLPITALLFLHPTVLPIAEDTESQVQSSMATYKNTRNVSMVKVTRTAFLPLKPQPWWKNETLAASMVLSFMERSSELATPDALPPPDCPTSNCLLEQIELEQLLKKSMQALKRINSTKITENSLSSTSQVNIVRNNQSEKTFVFNKSEYENDAIVLDWQDGRWRPVVRLSGATVLLDSANYWSRWRADIRTSDCDSDACKEDPNAFLWTGLANLWIALAILCGCLFVTVVAIGLTVLIRRHLMRRRMFKGPCKILLSSSEFVFPKVTPDSRRVDVGMETMLCCWLQQLQEFGGPELDQVEKKQTSNLIVSGPNVGSGGAGAGTAATSGSNTPGGVLNMARTLMMQPGGRMNHTPTVARYNGDVVQLKELPVAGTFELRNKAMKTLLMLHDLRHENINPVLGCLLDTGRPSLVLEWGTRGSLQDVLMQDDIKLDWSFRLSLLTDLVRGMRFLHATPLRVHGRLSSRNCVIDARWVLKVTDYGLPAFYELQGITPPPQTCRDLLWTAPELLRSESLRRKGTQPGDVFSFGIIMQEVVLRGEPYCVLHLKPEEIIEKLKKPPPLIRPSVSKGAAPPEAINIMRQCWAELPSSRPDFNTVNDQFKILNNGRKANFVDTMFQMLEKYSNNLEELIRQRTEQLDWEKRKTEQLLNRMLPCSVAEKLKMGQPVEPEHYEEVTIYFSDIVGFTAISSHSTAHQVVDLLNDLYTCFDATINAYNVYKVETIGDAYMVVGGLPVRISDHADQVATMALDLLHQSGRFQIGHLPNTPLRLRIGIHTGPCCAGVVGLTMPRYCLFGDTVNTASRMESTGSAWRIHISETTKVKLDEVGDYIIEFRGQTEVKGKGFMPTYWLLGKHGFNKELPEPPLIGLNEKLYLLNSTSSNISDYKGEDAPVPLSPRVNGSTINPAAIKASSGVPLTAAPVANQIAAADRRHQQVRASASLDMERCGGLARRGSRQIASESARIGLATMSIHSELWSSTSSRRSSRDLTESASMDMISEAPSSGNENTSNSQSGRPETVLNGIPFIGGSTMSVAGLSTPFSASEMAVDNLGVAFLNPPSTWRSSSTNLAAHLPRTRTPGFHQEGEDLSSAYNTYRCLAPGSNQKIANMAAGRGFLKRQFSLDRGDDPQLSSSSGAAPRLHKQNSAGAAAELHRIEEAPPTSQ